MICHSLKTFVDVFTVTRPSSPFHVVLLGGQRQFTPEQASLGGGAKLGFCWGNFWIFVSLRCLFFCLAIRSHQGVLTGILYLLWSSALWA